MKFVTLLLACLSIAAAAQTKTSSKSNSGKLSGSKTEILWDKEGVPHIYGQSPEAMYYGFGYAQMQNHANLLIRLYGQARGKAAEYWGPNYLSSDKLVTLFDLPKLAELHAQQQPAEYRGCLEAFVKGLNAYAQAHPEAIGADFKQALPITVPDVLSHVTRVMCLEFIGTEEATAGRLMPPGSNAYAIAPSKSASKNAMLMANPHLPWEDLFVFFEAHLNGPDFMAYGASLVGYPVLNIAFNNHLGWTHTVNTIDAADRYQLTLQGDGYLLDGNTQAFEKKNVTLQVKQPDGQIKPQTFTYRYSKHGAVMNSQDGKTYALKIAGLENPSLAAEHHAMARAHNWKEFETALKQMQIPMFNVIYADQEGNIMYLFNGNVPKRSEGDWRFWQRAIDGTASKFIWTNTHPYSDLPKVFNPKTGFVQNANDAPWSSTYPAALDPKAYASYMSPQTDPLRLRPQRSINLVKDDASITFDELASYKLNTGLEAADRFLDDLLLAVEQHPDSTANQAAAVLRSWDRATNNDSKGAVIFTKWFDQLSPDMAATKWDPLKPVSTPDGLKNPKQAVELLVKVAQQVQRQFGRLDVTWGEVNRFGPAGKDFPANGAPDHYGTYRTVYFAPTGSPPAKARAVAGDSYVAITEFGNKVRAEVSLSYGNATQPNHPHNGDQWERMSAKKLRPALLDRTEILKNLEKKEELLMDKKN